MSTVVICAPDKGPVCEITLASGPSSSRKRTRRIGDSRQKWRRVLRKSHQPRSEEAAESKGGRRDHHLCGRPWRRFGPDGMADFGPRGDFRSDDDVCV